MDVLGLRCFLFKRRFVGFSSLFSNKAPVPTFGGSLGPFLGKQHHFVQPRSVLKLFVCVCLPSGLKHDVAFLVRPKHYCERHFLPVTNAISSFFLPNNIFQESNTGGVYWNNVQCQAYYWLYLYPGCQYPLVGSQNVQQDMSSPFFFAGREGLWSHHYGVKARILVVRFGC